MADPKIATGSGSAEVAPDRQHLVLTGLILVAAVANLNLLVASVALPSIGDAFDASQTQLNLVAVAYSLGLAASVLWFGAIGDRYGRKLMLLLGTGLAIPASIVAAIAPNVPVLVGARIAGGLAAGMAYPTTLALITVLWSGAGRTRSIALWSGTGGAIVALGPVISGFLLEHFDWGSAFVITIPVAAVALPMAWFLVPGHVEETSEPVDNLGGTFSLVAVGSLILAINFAPVPNKLALVIGLGLLTLVALGAFILRQLRVREPLYDLNVAGRRTFWVAACAGVIVFGSLTGAMFVGQQYLQNVLGYSALEAGAGILPGAFGMVIAAPISARLLEARGSRITLLCGYLFVLAGFGAMLLLWREDTPYWEVGLAYALIGIGVGLAGTPASHSLTGSVPVHRAGMASGTADLQRDLGGAIMQSLFGALLTAGYASAFASEIASAPSADQQQLTDSVQATLTKSFSSAAELAQQNPQYSSEIINAAKSAFLQGDQWAYIAGFVAVLIGTVLVFIAFPRKDVEEELLAQYHREDSQPKPGVRPAVAKKGTVTNQRADGPRAKGDL